MATFWYPDTCSEDKGCVLQVSADMTTLVGIAKTCTGHAQSQWGRTVKLNMSSPSLAILGDQVKYISILSQNKAGIKEPVAIG